MDNKPISILVDNDSWILSYAEMLTVQLQQQGHEAALYRSHDALPDGGFACFFLGCVKIATSETLAKHEYNLVVHESDLPKGRGFAPMSWQILEGKSEIMFCLLEAADEADAGDIYLRKTIQLNGTELCDELRNIQGQTTIDMVMAFLAQERVPTREKQEGTPSIYPRRRPQDSALDIGKTIAEQFPLLRIVDNERYPAFFEMNGVKYKLKISKIEG